MTKPEVFVCNIFVFTTTKQILIYHVFFPFLMVITWIGILRIRAETVEWNYVFSGYKSDAALMYTSIENELDIVVNGIETTSKGNISTSKNQRNHSFWNISCNMFTKPWYCNTLWIPGQSHDRHVPYHQTCCCFRHQTQGHSWKLLHCYACILQI